MRQWKVREKKILIVRKIEGALNGAFEAVGDFAALRKLDPHQAPLIRFMESPAGYESLTITARSRIVVFLSSEQNDDLCEWLLS